jgi:hypothetical protein
MFTFLEVGVKWFIFPDSVPLPITISQSGDKPGVSLPFILSPEVFNISPVKIVSGLAFCMGY